MEYKLGVIGGMGSEATSYFFKEVVAHTEVKKDQDHIDTVILNHASLPDRTEAILTGDDEEFINRIVQDIQLLEKINVQNIAIPCNTTHYFYNIIQEETSVPIIHMPKESVASAVSNFDDVKKIGIMATTGTIRTGIYRKECEEMGVELVAPSEAGQEDVMSLIYDEIKKGLPGDRSKFDRAYQELIAAGSDVIILACTELSVFGEKNELYDNCLDAMEVLVKEVIARSEEYQEVL
ncbi:MULTISPECIES: cysteate racemase [Salimicrobium]|uniref:Aspartate racemase n=3 Tax=Salimicrobium TaxID=351195 RepID=K2H7U1_9BACI|nr:MULTISPECIES: amino acid racemase [Salimicrobium]AKG04762.1 aspartate racemase [Salimicrobium jeotgali]EKE31730.1 aspartate racemase [Salimicrobium jeotgali]MBM7696310.1 aspartate racemase [Salimicrobium jeotgali]SDX37879.1 aspartate racemase [Salimicrobium album]SIS47113.1 aspartate racemase [Salimicrobium salexigens]